MWTEYTVTECHPGVSLTHRAWQNTSQLMGTISSRVSKPRLFLPTHWIVISSRSSLILDVKWHDNNHFHYALWTVRLGVWWPLFRKFQKITSDTYGRVEKKKKSILYQTEMEVHSVQISSLRSSDRNIYALCCTCSINQDTMQFKRLCCNHPFCTHALEIASCTCAQPCTGVSV